MSAIATLPAATAPGPIALLPQNLGEAMKLAELMAHARLVPKHLQGSPSDCLLVIEQAQRWRMSPFAVAQATSSIQGKLMYEGKLVAAAVHTSGATTTRLDYVYSGEGEGRQVEVRGTRTGETEPRAVTVTLKEARTTNEMWKRQPDQQLAYHGARVWSRRWVPEVILGVYSPEEMGPIVQAPPQHAGATIDAPAEPPHDPDTGELPGAISDTDLARMCDQAVMLLRDAQSDDDVSHAMMGDWWLTLLERAPKRHARLMQLADEARARVGGQAAA